MREWLKNARLNRGLTMKKMADELHISESYYCSIENGYRQKDMDISLAEKIHASLGIPVKEILKFERILRENQIIIEQHPKARNQN